MILARRNRHNVGNLRAVAVYADLFNVHEQAVFHNAAGHTGNDSLASAVFRADDDHIFDRTEQFGAFTDKYNPLIRCRYVDERNILYYRACHQLTEHTAEPCISAVGRNIGDDMPAAVENPLETDLCTAVQKFVRRIDKVYGTAGRRVDIRRDNVVCVDHRCCVRRRDVRKILRLVDEHGRNVRRYYILLIGGSINIQREVFRVSAAVQQRIQCALCKRERALCISDPFRHFCRTRRNALHCAFERYGNGTAFAFKREI